jgi:hypothetical protein
LFATAPDYFRNVNPEAADLMPDWDEDNAWLLSASKERGLKVVHSNEGGDPYFVIELLQERFE